MFPSDHNVNDPDYDSVSMEADPRSSFARGVRSGQRNIGWDTEF